MKKLLFLLLPLFVVACGTDEKSVNDSDTTGVDSTEVVVDSVKNDTTKIIKDSLK